MTGRQALKAQKPGAGPGLVLALVWPLARQLKRYNTWTMADTTASMLRVFNAATQMRPVSTP